MTTQFFELGQILVTPGALALADCDGINLLSYLQRHICGDWGDLTVEDREENDYSVSRCLRIFSAYNTPNGRLWIVTEADRSATTLLLPDEY